MAKKALPATERLKTQLKKLPQRECANWGGVCRSCLVEQGKKCGYLKRAVLPRFPELRREYSANGVHARKKSPAKVSI
jgi:hypothetical protein